MPLHILVQRLLDRHIEFNVRWNDDVESYGLYIILGNCEYFVAEEDEESISQLWNMIEMYWI